MRLADMLATCNRHGDAIGLISSALGEQPNDVGLKLLLGHLHYGAGHLDEARGLYEEVVALTSNVQALTMLGRLAEEAGESQRAAAFFQAALDRDERYRPAATALAELWMREGRESAAALRVIDRALGYHPEHPLLLELRRRLTAR